MNGCLVCRISVITSCMLFSSANFRLYTSLSYLNFLSSDELLDSLNGMHYLMTGQKNSFDAAFYNELVQCIERYDARLLGVINSQWRGFRSYANNGGNPGIDDWISCDTRVSNLINRKY